MTDEATDRRFLRQAIALAERSMRAGQGGPFGALVVRDGVVIGEGANAVTTTQDPTAHAEIVALRRACVAVQDFALPGATVYASCEPCPMCLGAIYWARCARIVFAANRDEAAAIGFSDAAIYDEIPKPLDARTLPTRQLKLPEAEALFAGWLSLPHRVDY